MKRRYWTEPDLEYLRAHYKTMPVAVLAKKLKRTVRSIYNTAKLYGMATEKMVVSDESIKAALRRFHPKGWSDEEIAMKLGTDAGANVDRHRVGRMRRALELACNKGSRHQRELIRQRTKQQLAKAALPTLASVRVARFNRWKRDLGWPEHLTVRAVQSLEMFYRHGPLTRAQLCVLLGVSSKSRTAPKSRAKGGTVLAELAAAGLISRVSKAVEVPFDLKLHDDPYGSKPRTTNRVIRTKHVSMYFLNPGVEPNEHRKAAERTEAGGVGPADNGNSQGHSELAGSDAVGSGQLCKRRRHQSDRQKEGRKGQAG